MNLDHVTIRTRDLQATRSFFLRVFDLEEGKRMLLPNVRIILEDDKALAPAALVTEKCEVPRRNSHGSRYPDILFAAGAHRVAVELEIH